MKRERDRWPIFHKTFKLNLGIKIHLKWILCCRWGWWWHLSQQRGKKHVPAKAWHPKHRMMMFPWSFTVSSKFMNKTQGNDVLFSLSFPVSCFHLSAGFFGISLNLIRVSLHVQKSFYPVFSPNTKYVSFTSNSSSKTPKQNHKESQESSLMGLFPPIWNYLSSAFLFICLWASLLSPTHDLNTILSTDLASRMKIKRGSDGFYSEWNYCQDVS